MSKHLTGKLTIGDIPKLQIQGFTMASNIALFSPVKFPINGKQNSTFHFVLLPVRI